MARNKSVDPSQPDLPRLATPAQVAERSRTSNPDYNIQL
jgi:hypothetical protein